MREAVQAVADVCGRERVGLRISPTNTHHNMSDADPETLYFTLAAGLDKIGLVYMPRRRRRDPARRATTAVRLSQAPLAVSRRLYCEQRLHP